YCLARFQKRRRYRRDESCHLLETSEEFIVHDVAASGQRATNNHQLNKPVTLLCIAEIELRDSAFRSDGINMLRIESKQRIQCQCRESCPMLTGIARDV